MAQRAFIEHETSGLEPAISKPKIQGGVLVAKIDSSFVYKGRRYRTREASAFRGKKVVAVCLGKRRTGAGQTNALEPCECGEHPVAKGEDPFAAIVAAHPTEGELRKRHEQHVVALFCSELLDPEGHVERVRVHKERVEALAKANPVERQALIAEWKTDPRTPGNAPVEEFVGLLSDEQWGTSGYDLTM